MRRYRVRVVQSTGYLYEIEATNEEDARREAERRAQQEYENLSPDITFEYETFLRPLEQHEDIFNPEHAFENEEK